MTTMMVLVMVISCMVSNGRLPVSPLVARTHRRRSRRKEKSSVSKTGRSMKEEEQQLSL